jgi:hypothetical protein
MFRLAFTAALLASAASADAATLLRYSIAPVSGAGVGSFEFVLDVDRTPDIRLSDSVRYFNVPVTYRLPGDAADRTATPGITFFSPIQQGGLFIGFLSTGNFRLLNTPLFTGPTTNPQFLTGTFRLSTTAQNNGPRPFDNYLLRVTAVPEPSSWALMIVGFGLVGSALRRRPVVA